MAQGGEFHTGFVTGAIGKASSLATESTELGSIPGVEGKFIRTVISATAGGTASELTGGKFANGAITAAFAHLYNQESRRGLNAPLSLSDGYRGEINVFNTTGQQASFEIHVFDSNGKEVGIYGPEGWVNRHGHRGPPSGIPSGVENSLRGITIDRLRKAQLIPEKGAGRIKGIETSSILKTFGKAFAIIGAVGVAIQDRPGDLVCIPLGGCDDAQ